MQLRKIKPVIAEFILVLNSVQLEKKQIDEEFAFNGFLC